MAGKPFALVEIGLDVEATEQSFGQLKGIIEKEVAKIEPIKLKLDIDGTSKELTRLSELIKDVSSNINKINSSGGIGGGFSGNSQAISEQVRAYRELSDLQKKIASYSKEALKLDPIKDPNQFQNAITHLREYQQAYDKLLAKNKEKLSTDQIQELEKAYRTLSEAIDKITAKNADKVLTDAARAQAQAAAEAQKAVAAEEAAQDKMIMNAVAQGNAWVAEQEKKARASEEAAQKAVAAEEAAQLKMAQIAAKQGEAWVAEQERRKKAAEEASAAEALQNERSLKSLYTMLTQVQTLKDKIANGQGGTGAQSFQGLVALEASINSLIASGGASKEQMAALGTELARLKNEANGAGDATRTFGGGLSSLESRMVYMLSLSNLLMKAWRELKQMVSTAIELDSAMTQLRIVTNNSEAEYAAYGKSVASTAQQIGASITDLIDSTTTFARLGYSLSDSSELSRLTSMLKNVGDIDVSSAQNALTAISKAFDIGGSEIEAAMDKMIVVGNNFPISVAELAEGMNNAGSALAASGNSFEQSIALLTAANTTIQDIHKSSTGLRTITARIRKTKTELDDLGETVNSAKYQEVLDMLTGKGVALTDANGYRATYDILKDIASIWNELDTMSQAAIAEQLAGNRQQNVFYSIINQFQEAEGAMTEMQNSTGALSDAYGKYMNSIEAHIGSFKAAYESLAQTVVNSDFAKGIVDAGTAILNTLDKVFSALDKIGGILPVITGFVGFLVTKNLSRIFSATGLASIGSWVGGIVNAIKTVSSLSGMQKIAGMGDGLITKAIFGSIGPAGTVGLIVAATTAVAALIYHLAKMPKGYEAATQAVTDAGNKLDELNGKYEENKNRIEELEAIRGSSTWTVQQETELRNLETENTLLEAQIELQKQLKEIAEEDQRKAARDEANKLTGDFEDPTARAGVRTIGDVLDDYQKVTNKIKEAASERDALDPEKDSKKIAKLNTEIERYSRAQSTYGEGLLEKLKLAEDILPKLDPETDADTIAALNSEIERVNKTLNTTRNTATATKDAFAELEEYGAGGNVDLTNRPVIDAKALTKAGWVGAGDGTATVYSSTYANKDETIAANFTPIIVNPETGKAIGIMTPEALQSYAEGVIDGVHDDYLNLQIGANFEGKDAIKNAEETAEAIHEYHEELYADIVAQSSDALAIVSKAPKTYAEVTKDALQGLLDSEEFTSQKESLIELANSFDGITAENIEDLASKSSELAGFLERDGMSAQFLAFILQKELTGGNGLDLITDQSLRLNGVLSEITERTKGATAALQEYANATSSEKGDAAAQYVNAYKQFSEDWAAGKTGTNAVEAAVKLILPESALADLDYDLQAAGELLSSTLYKSIFSAEGDPGANFAKYIKDSYGNALDGIVDITSNGDKFNFAVSSAQELADAMNLDVDAVNAFLDALDAYGVQVMMTGEESRKLADSLGLIGNSASNITKVQSVISQLANIGQDAFQIKGALDSLSSAGYIDTSGIENLGGMISEAVQEAKAVGDVEVEPTVKVDIAEAEKNVNTIQNMINNVHGKTVDVVVNHIDNYVENHTTNGGSSSDDNKSASNAHASGTRNAPGGKSLVNELGPELISENGRAYIANGGEPAIVNLSKGAVVLNADETKKALRGNGVHERFINAYARGTTTGNQAVATKKTQSSLVKNCINCGAAMPYNAANCPSCGAPQSAAALKAWKDGQKKTAQIQSASISNPVAASVPTSYSGGGGGGGGGGGSSSGSSGSSGSSSSQKEESWFEKQYKEHKHLIEMDQEQQQDYLDWLDAAYKKAYAEGVIDLDDYYKYQEEVYKGQQDLFKDNLDDLEHAVEMAEKGGTSPTTIINMYQDMLDKVSSELNAAYQQGLDENNDYVQYLQNQWYNYYDKLKDMREDSDKDAKSAVDDLVQYRIKMLKQYIKNEIDSLKDRLSYLKDFYSQQKELLKDIYEEEDYLEEQSSKRKNVSDIQNQLTALENDTSAWAQKRKLQLQEELKSAQDELNKFERDHALDVATEQLDAAYEIQERAINAKIDQLEAKADDPKALYDQALKDVQNNSVELYEEMIEYNNKYGTGIKQDIVDMWENAYISLKNYADLYHEFYNGINLVNATNYNPADKEVDQQSIVRGATPTQRTSKPVTIDTGETTPKSVSDLYSDLDPQAAAAIEAAQAAMQANLNAVLGNIQAAQQAALSQLGASAQSALSGIVNNTSSFGNINLGDIIIQGNANEATVSEIRRAQRDSVSSMLKSLNTLNNR